MSSGVDEGLEPATASQHAASRFRPSDASTPFGCGYAQVSGLDVYYEVHGRGEPLIVLHGGLMTIELMGEQIAALAKSRQVIAIELEGHGHTPLRGGPLRYEQMADDVAAVMAHLGLEQADVLGFSLGGGVAWQVAIRHPGRVRKLVTISAPVKTEGWAAVMREAVDTLNAEAAEGMKETPMYAAYARVAPRPDDWPELVSKLGRLASSADGPYDWSVDVQAITAPTLMVVGDADSVLLEAALRAFRRLGGGVIGDFTPLPSAQLAIIPGAAHSAVLERIDLLIPIIVPFLDAPVAAA